MIGSPNKHNEIIVNLPPFSIKLAVFKGKIRCFGSLVGCASLEIPATEERVIVAGRGSRPYTESMGTLFTPPLGNPPKKAGGNSKGKTKLSSDSNLGLLIVIVS